jgi:hypothetical protein
LPAEGLVGTSFIAPKGRALIFFEEMDTTLAGPDFLIGPRLDLGGNGIWVSDICAL